MKYIILPLVISLPLSLQGALLSLPPAPAGFSWVASGNNLTFTDSASPSASGTSDLPLGNSQLFEPPAPLTVSSSETINMSDAVLSHSAPVGSGEITATVAGQTAYLFVESTFSYNAVFENVTQPTGALLISDAQAQGTNFGPTGEFGTFEAVQSISILNLSLSGAATSSAVVGSQSTSNTFDVDNDEGFFTSPPGLNIQADFDFATATATTATDITRLSGDGAFNPNGISLSGSQSTDFTNGYTFDLADFDSSIAMESLDGTLQSAFSQRPVFSGNRASFDLNATANAQWNYAEFVLTETAVPEPSSSLFLSIAAFAFLGRRTRK